MAVQVSTIENRSFQSSSKDFSSDRPGGDLGRPSGGTSLLRGSAGVSQRPEKVELPEPGKLPATLPEEAFRGCAAGNLPETLVKGL